MARKVPIDQLPEEVKGERDPPVESLAVRIARRLDPTVGVDFTEKFGPVVVLLLWAIATIGMLFHLIDWNEGTVGIYGGLSTLAGGYLKPDKHE